MPRKTVQKIRQHLINGEYRYSMHCERTAYDRIVTDEDIRQVGQTAFTAKLQRNGSYKLIGFDAQNMELTVICRLSSQTGALIITVF